MRLERNDTTRPSNQSRKQQRLRPDGGADVEDGVSGVRRVLVEKNVPSLSRENGGRRRAPERRVRNSSAGIVVDPGAVAPTDEARRPARDADPDRGRHYEKPSAARAVE